MANNDGKIVALAGVGIIGAGLIIYGISHMGTGQPTPAPGIATLSGTISDKITGNPIPGAVLTMNPSSGGNGYTITADHNGDYSFSNIPTGIYNLMVQATGYATANF